MRPAPDTVAIVAATAQHLHAIRELLTAARLPLDGIDDLVDTAVVARTGDAVVGAAAVELYADGALLRSVVVTPSLQGIGLGRRLTEAALAVAKDRGASTAFLLTTTAEGYYPKLGFERIAREDVPGSLQQSVEFHSACPASAVAMRKALREPNRR